MKPNHDHLATLLPLLSNAAALHTLYTFFSDSQEAPISDCTGLLLWWSCLTLTYIVLAWFLRRPRSLRGIMGIAAGGFLAQLILTLLLARHPVTFLAWAALLFLWGCLYGRCCMLLLDGVKPEAVATAFETTVLMLFVAAFGVTLSVMAPENLLCTAVGVLFSLIAMARLRSGHARVDTQVQTSFRGRGLLAAVLLGLGAAAALLCVLLAGSASQLLTRLTQWLWSVLRAAAGAVGRFLQWLVSLFPAKEVDPALLADPEMAFPIGGAEWGTLDNGLPFYLALALLAALLLAVLLWLWKTGGIRRITFRSRTVGRVVRKRPGLRALLAQFWRQFARWVSFQSSYLKLRNTAPGLFVWLERQMRTRHLARRAGETPRVFLQRTQAAFPESVDALTRLSDCLDRHYFGGGQTLSPTEIAAMRKQLRRAIRSPHQTSQGGISHAA